MTTERRSVPIDAGRAGHPPSFASWVLVSRIHLEPDEVSAAVAIAARDSSCAAEALGSKRNLAPEQVDMLVAAVARFGEGCAVSALRARRKYTTAQQDALVATLAQDGWHAADAIEAERDYTAEQMAALIASVAASRHAHTAAHALCANRLYTAEQVATLVASVVAWSVRNRPFAASALRVDREYTEAQRAMLERAAKGDRQ